MLVPILIDTYAMVVCLLNTCIAIPTALKFRAHLSNSPKGEKHEEHGLTEGLKYLNECFSS